MREQGRAEYWYFRHRKKPLWNRDPENPGDQLDIGIGVNGERQLICIQHSRLVTRQLQRRSLDPQSG